MILNWIDGVVLFLVGTSSVFGLFRGFIGVLLSLSGYILSLYMTYLLQPIVYSILVAGIPGRSIRIKLSLSRP